MQSNINSCTYICSTKKHTLSNQNKSLNEDIAIVWQLSGGSNGVKNLNWQLIVIGKSSVFACVVCEGVYDHRIIRYRHTTCKFWNSVTRCFSPKCSKIHFILVLQHDGYVLYVCETVQSFFIFQSCHCHAPCDVMEQKLYTIHFDSLSMINNSTQ